MYTKLGYRVLTIGYKGCIMSIVRLKGGHKMKCPRNEHIDCYAISEEQAKECLKERICQAQGDKPKTKPPEK